MATSSKSSSSSKAPAVSKPAAPKPAPTPPKPATPAKSMSQVNHASGNVHSSSAPKSLGGAHQSAGSHSQASPSGGTTHTSAPSTSTAAGVGNAAPSVTHSSGSGGGGSSSSSGLAAITPPEIAKVTVPALPATITEVAKPGTTADNPIILKPGEVFTSTGQIMSKTDYDKQQAEQAAIDAARQSGDTTRSKIVVEDIKVTTPTGLISETVRPKEQISYGGYEATRWYDPVSGTYMASDAAHAQAGDTIVGHTKVSETTATQTYTTYNPTTGAATNITNKIYGSPEQVYLDTMTSNELKTALSDTGSFDKYLNEQFAKGQLTSTTATGTNLTSNLGLTPEAILQRSTTESVTALEKLKTTATPNMQNIISEKIQAIKASPTKGPSFGFDLKPVGGVQVGLQRLGLGRTTPTVSLGTGSGGGLQTNIASGPLQSAIEKAIVFRPPTYQPSMSQPTKIKGFMPGSERTGGQLLRGSGGWGITNKMADYAGEWATKKFGPQGVSPQGKGISAMLKGNIKGL
jgi:hypothetical protein